MIRWDDPQLVNVGSDSWRQGRLRRLQSWYRETVLRLEPGVDRQGVLRGNLLRHRDVEREPGANLLDEGIARYVRERLPVARAAKATIEVDRLRRNLLSSMPLCFNLFGALRRHPDVVPALLNQVLGRELVGEIVQIEVEWAPDPLLHLGDRTAFDALVEYRTPSGALGFLGVETKYAEGPDRGGYDKPSYRKLTVPELGWRPGAADALVDSAANQLWRNTLLTQSFQAATGHADAHMLLLRCADDRVSASSFERLSGQLVDPDARVLTATYEQVIDVARTMPALETWAVAFDRRYLDLSPVL